ncbi:DUF4136 domain-containing protein [Tamlana sp. I1]|uniref:DUF4136 domain-containing protein n=1 Tax=Tamlana sp. I1 TaxID=2762061 RepID=UPI00188F217C|nr:DUF4136 domain-containing protein [Tamlana sp. I1]
MKSRMKFLSIPFIALLLSVSAFAQVKSDYDKSIDFTKYKTYSFAGWEKDSDKILTDFDKKRITDAMKSQFDSRGLKLVQTGGDAAVTLYIVVNNKTSTTAYTDFNGGMGYGMGRWGWGYGMGMGTGMVSATTTYNEDDYKEGTFVVDMYDEGSKKLVWQGVITSVVNEKPKKREKTIPRKIKKLMKSYPVKPIKK